MAEFVSKGIGIKSNPRRSASLLARAAKLGLPIAQFRYGLCLAQGYGGQGNKSASDQWISTSASNGCDDATQYIELLAEFQRQAVFDWLNSMFERDCFSDMLDRQTADYNRGQAESSWKIMDRQRINAP